jgi:hypothetical protein
LPPKYFAPKYLIKKIHYMMNLNGLENGNNKGFIKYMNRQLNELEF